MTIGEKIKAFRVKHLLTLQQAAKIFGVSGTEIFRLEDAKHKPQLLTEAKWEKKLLDAEEALKNE